MWITHETIYRNLFVQTHGVFKKELIRHVRHLAQCDAPSLGVQMGSSRDGLLTVFRSWCGQRPIIFGPFNGTGNWIDCRGGTSPIWTPSIFDDHGCYRQTMKSFGIDTFPPKRAVSFPESRTGKNWNFLAHCRQEVLRKRTNFSERQMVVIQQPAVTRPRSTSSVGRMGSVK